MKEMVNAFSEYARAPDIEISRFDLNELIREVAELYLHRELPLALTLDLDPGLPAIEADPGRIRQLLHNLIRNALEAMEHQKEEKLSIATRLRSDREVDVVEITVADNGPGFATEIACLLYTSPSPRDS